MDELPRRAKDVLRLARELDDCRDDEARARVREGVIEAVRGTAPGSLAPAAAKPAVGLSLPALGVKLAAIGGLLGLLGAGVAWQTRDPAPRPATPLAVSAPSHVVADEAQGEAHAVPSRRSTESPPARRPRVEPLLPRRDTLDLEIALLRSVDEALARRNTSRAKSLLNQHRARFAQPALREEHEGFRALVRCMDRADDAALTAQQFVARFPQSVLASRVQHECAVEEPRR